MKRQIKIDGDLAYVPLTKGYTAIIDSADAHLLAAYNWKAQLSGKVVYAVRNEMVNGKWVTHRMHQIVKGRIEGKEVDHIDGNGLNNRRSNLRHATHAENMRNQRVRADNTSGSAGVHFHKRDKKWVAYINCDGSRRNLGHHKCRTSALVAYAKASKLLHGEFSRA
jgi:hypothetical protein